MTDLACYPPCCTTSPGWPASWGGLARCCRCPSRPGPSPSPGWPTGQLAPAPIVVAVPTTTDAERLAHDLAAFLGDDEVELFPAWETLPFERVSPSVETMGRRLRTIWRLTGGAPARERGTVAAGCRGWWWPRCGPWCSGSDPTSTRSSRSWSASRTGWTRPSWWPAWWRPGTAARSWSSTGARWPCAARSSTCSAPPPTCRCASTCGATRWTGSPSSRCPTSARPSTSPRWSCSGAASCCPPTRCGPGPRPASPPTRGVASSGSGWPQGLIFDGMESWLPWLTDDEQVLFDLLGPEAQVLLVEPRRMRDRAADILAEEADLAATLAVTWGVPGAGDDAQAGGVDGLPQLHLPFDRLLVHTTAPTWTVTTAPEGPGRGHGGGQRLGAGGGRRRRPGQPAERPAGRRLPGGGGRRRRRLGGPHRRPARRAGRPSGARTSRRAPTSSSRAAGGGRSRSSAGSCCRPSSWPCWPSPT